MQDKKMDWEEEERVRDKDIVAASDLGHELFSKRFVAFM